MDKIEKLATPELPWVLNSDSLKINEIIDLVNTEAEKRLDLITEIIAMKEKNYRLEKAVRYLAKTTIAGNSGERNVNAILEGEGE